MWRLISSGSKSQTVEPSSTLPARGMAPVAKRRASANVVFPAPLCPTRATLRIRDGGKLVTPSTSPRSTAGADHRRGCSAYRRGPDLVRGEFRASAVGRRASELVRRAESGRW